MVQIKRAAVEDLEGVSGLFFKIFNPLYKKFFKYNLKESTCRSISRTYILHADTFVAKDKGKVIGFAAATRSLLSLWKNPLDVILPSRYIFIAPARFRDIRKPMFLMMGVDKSYRKKGIATKLTKKVEERLKDQGVTEFFGQIHPKNKPIKQFLIKIGGKVIGRENLFSKALIIRKEL